MNLTNNKISDKEYCIEGYHKPVCQDRIDTKDGRGGGVLLLVKNSINFVQIVPHNSIGYTNSVWIEVVNNDGKKTVIGVVYRSPNSNVTNNEKLYNCINELSNRNLVIMGDFNYPCYVPGVTRRLRKPTSWLASNKLCLKFNKFI